MAKIVEVPMAGASITGDVAVVSLDDFVGSTDMAYSIALSARKAGKRVALLTEVDISYLLDWQDDPDPEVRVYDNATSVYDNMTVIVINSGPITREMLNIPSAQAVIGVTADSLKLTLDAFRLEQSNRMLLDELEKLLPPDSQVRKLRDELRRRIYK